MKKNIGSALALYPMPVTVIGTMNVDKPTWTLAAHVGSIGHDRVLVSLAVPHFINQFIKECKKLSINIVDEGFLPEADYVGSVTGAKEDKSAVFAYEMSEAGKINYNTLKPVLFEFPTYEYLKTGDVIGRCLSFKKNPNE